MLVLTFSWGMSLREWRGIGSIAREWAIYERLSRSYDRMVLVTYGTDAEEEAIAAQLARHEGARPVEVVWNADKLDDASWQARVPEEVARLVSGASSVLVKTNQMAGGTVAVSIRDELRSRGVTTGLIARGGYLWSRFVALQSGCDSTEAAYAAAMEGELCAAADVIVGTTASMNDDLSWRYGVSRDRCQMVPNYVLDAAPVRESSEREAGVILTAGQLCERKGQDVLIRAMALIEGRTQSPLRLEIIGEGPMEDELRALAEDLNAPVDFLGPYEHTELLERMSRCAMYAQASSYEGHPKTVIEAMATAAPIVAADAPGVLDVIEHGVTGVRVSRTPEAFAHVVEGLIVDPDWRDALGSHASEYARGRFGLRAIMPREIAAHRAAMSRAASEAGEQNASVTSPVRWSPPLLRASGEAQVDAWSNSLHGFQKRLAPDERVRFLANLEQRVYVMEGEAAKAAEGGLHPKHRYLNYHAWFVDRLEAGERVLDLGCGVGALGAAMAQRAEVTGIDWDPANLAEAQQRTSDSIELIEGDITSVRAPGLYDTVVLSNVLEHIADRPDRLRLWRAWYEPKRFLIRVPAFDREWRVPWKKEIGVEWRLDTTHETEFTLEQLREELSEAGLTITHTTTRWGEFWVEAVAVTDDASGVDAA